MDEQHRQIIRYANGMELFADGEPTFIIGEWRAWEKACTAEGRLIPPAEFKAWTEEKKLPFKRHIFEVENEH